MLRSTHSLTVAGALAQAMIEGPPHARDTPAKPAGETVRNAASDSVTGATQATQDTRPAARKTRHERRICRESAPTGTRISRKTCLTQAQWEEARQRSRDATGAVQKNQLFINRKIEGASDAMALTGLAGPAPRRLAVIAGLLLGGSLAAAPALAAGPPDGKDFPGVEKLMSAEDYAQAGLDKLTPDERAALNAWLVRYTAGDAAVLATTSQDVKKAAAEVAIVARIQPPFTGWEGDTVFRLDNGQVWRQRQPGRYRYSGDDTQVEVRKNYFGFYVLTLASSGRSVGVELVP